MYIYIHTGARRKKSTPHHCPEPEPRQPSSLSARNRDPNHVCCPPPLYSLLHPDASSPPLPRQCHTLQKVKPKFCLCDIELIYGSIHMCIYYIYVYICNMIFKKKSGSRSLQPQCYFCVRLHMMLSFIFPLASLLWILRWQPVASM